MWRTPSACRVGTRADAWRITKRHRCPHRQYRAMEAVGDPRAREMRNLIRRRIERGEWLGEAPGNKGRHPELRAAQKNISNRAPGLAGRATASESIGPRTPKTTPRSNDARSATNPGDCLHGPADLLLPFALIDDRIPLQQDGSLLTGWSYRGPDMLFAALSSQWEAKKAEIKTPDGNSINGGRPRGRIPQGPLSRTVLNESCCPGEALWGQARIY